MDAQRRWNFVRRTDCRPKIEGSRHANEDLDDKMNLTLDGLLIELILQDLKHNQLILGLDRLNLDAGYCHFLGILDLIKRLMGVPEELSDDF
ncbi:MAG: hypothetical protein WD431_19995 [Cyclobacteriaceae bacterium]